MSRNKKKIFLTIAGSDCSGGAGIQADIKIAFEHGLYACTAITALTVQDTFGVKSLNPVDSSIIGAQIDAIASDLRPDAVKIGLVHGQKSIETVASKLEKYKFPIVVLDPVISPTLGDMPFLKEEDLRLMIERIFPYVSAITPNAHEWEIINNLDVSNVSQNIPYIVITGNKAEGNRLFTKIIEHKGGEEIETGFYGNFIKTTNTHGTGCLFSSMLACLLAQGLSIHKAVETTMSEIEFLLESGRDVKFGEGPYGPAYL